MFLIRCVHLLGMRWIFFFLFCSTISAWFDAAYQNTLQSKLTHKIHFFDIITLEVPRTQHLETFRRCVAKNIKINYEQHYAFQNKGKKFNKFRLQK